MSAVSLKLIPASSADPDRGSREPPRPDGLQSLSGRFECSWQAEAGARLDLRRTRWALQDSLLVKVTFDPGLRRGRVQGLLLLEVCTLGGTRSQPFELLHTEEKGKVDKELQRPSAFWLGGTARIQQNEPRLLPAAVQFESGHRKSPPPQEPARAEHDVPPWKGLMRSLASCAYTLARLSPT